MDQKQLSQLDPKLKAVYDRVMGIANTAPPPPPQMAPSAAPQPPTMQMPQSFGMPAQPVQGLPQSQVPTPLVPPVPPRPSFVVEEVNNTAPSMQTPMPPVLPQIPTPPVATPPHTDQGQTFFAQNQAIPTFRAAQQAPMQPMQASIPVVHTQPTTAVHNNGNSHVFMVLFIILGIIFFILYGIFWVQLFNIGIPALTSS